MKKKKEYALYIKMILANTFIFCFVVAMYELIAQATGRLSAFEAMNVSVYIVLSVSWLAQIYYLYKYRKSDDTPDDKQQ